MPSSPWTFMETKYPHVDTMKALGIFEDVELVLKNMHLAKLFSYHMESYKELTCEFLASMRYHMYEEEDRADLDQGLGWITFLAKGEKRMVTFRQLEILFGFNYGEGTKWNFKEKELQRVWATIADGVYSSSRSKAAQDQEPRVGWEFQFKFTHPLVGPPSFSCPNPELTTGVRTLTSDPLFQESADLGEPECYYFEEYEAPRMNPSVVAAHKRIGLLQKFNKWQGKAIERCKSPWTRW
ncbi:unnamed protein product [Microthlaspi erraticum]|uniref:Arabidopsis retrotransposon Orf1 C-terminal domain-containing protein n=1 Tax=Microthlaspi erraticum TaxID=1685480 RepID=A0A6D2KQ93_9BRAS|nr:unnamed protein product [Microthlaspi erraticum]